MLDNEKTTLLDQPLDMTRIKHRQGGGGRQLAYISGKFAMDQANRIFGYGQWGYKVVNRGQLLVDGPDGNKLTMYTADVELWVTGADFAFPGAGVGIVTKPYTVDMHEKAYKEAETDAMKRALRHYGDQFGLCLYDGEDYVDAGNGEMVQVKNVPIQGRPQQQAPRQLPAANKDNQQPTSINKAPSIKVLRKKCDEMFGPGQWDAVLAILFNAIIPDDNITPEQASQINTALSTNATDQQIASIKKLCQHLDKPEPEKIADLNYIVARRTIHALTVEYKASRLQNKAS